MAASLLRSSLSFPSSFPGAEDSPTPPAKRFSPASNPEMATTRSKTVASIPSRKDGSERTTEHFARYGLALQVYSALRSGKLPGGVRYPDAETKRTVYRLVFDVLYHQEVIEELLIESGFYSRNCDLHGHESLVLLMAFDYQDRRFLLKVPQDESENIPSLVLKVGEALSKHRVRLNAALARMRVKSNAQSTSQLLSEASYVKYQAIVTEPFYFRVNSKCVKNVRTEIMISLLVDDGFTLCSSKEELQRGEKLFCRMHTSLLAVSSDAKETMLQHHLVNDGHLVPQDRASYFMIESMRDILSQSSGAVIITHCNAGVEVAHVGSMLSGTGKVIVYGALPVQMDSLWKALHVQDINNVEFVQAPFSHADPTSEALADVSTIICLPPSSLSTVTQPLDFIQQEGDHCAPLLLSEKMGLARSMSREQRDTLAQALNFSQCQHIVYAVRSQSERETSDVVTTALEQHRATKKEGDLEKRDYLAIPRGDLVMTDAGYHMTLLERKPEDPKPTPSSIIARAIVSGVLSGEGLDIDTQPQIHTKKKRKKAPRIFSQHKGIPMTISAKNKVVPKKLSASDSNARRPFR